ncbi:mitochondrial acyl carrier protein, partial [Desmophyllum pertusum]
MVNAIYRHGDRSPSRIYPTDPYREDVWPQGLGMLTQKGMRQEYALGKFLKSRYIEHYKLLNSTYISKEIWRDNLDWQPIGIHVVPLDEDYLLAPFAYKCPRFFQLHNADKKQPGYINMSLEYKDMLDYVSENSGQEIDVSSAWKIRDPLIAE